MAALWVVALIVLLVGSQFVRWSLQIFATIGQVDLSGLPLPILILAGTGLAIAANSRKQWGVSMDRLLDDAPNPTNPTPPAAPPSVDAAATPPPIPATPHPAMTTNPVRPTPPQSTVPAAVSTAPSHNAASVSYQIDPTHHRDERRRS